MGTSNPIVYKKNSSEHLKVVVPRDRAFSVLWSKRLLKPVMAARRPLAFLLMVGAITVGLVGILKAWALLDAQAGLYTAPPLEAHPVFANTSPDIVASIGTKATMSEPAPAATPALPIAPAIPIDVAMSASQDVRAAAHDERPDEVANAESGRGDNVRFTTVYIHRGRAPPTAYVVPRE